MASQSEHFAQAKKNFLFLESVNNNIDNCWDWQITIAFYSALHLINGYIAERIDGHYMSHSKIDNMINPEGKSPIRLSEEVYLSYKKLHMLSRRSRYLCNDKNPTGTPEKAFHANDRLFMRAIRYLDNIINFYTGLYKVSIDKVSISCLEFDTSENLKFVEKKIK